MTLPFSSIVFTAPALDETICLPICSYGPDEQLSIIEVALAAISSPPLFPPTKSRSGQEFIGTQPKFANPLNELLQEAEREYGREQRVACILSLGSEQSQPTINATQSPVKGLESYLYNLATKCALRSAEHSHQYLGMTTYLRCELKDTVNSTTRLGWCSFDSTRVIAESKTYAGLPKTTKHLNYAVERLKGYKGTATLNQLSE
jgi:hypothetical protein